MNIRQRVRVIFAAQLLEPVENWPENIRLVIRDRTGEILETLCALDHCDGALETHSGVDVSRCSGTYGMAESAPGYRLRIELDEDQVPNLDASRIIFVHEAPWVSPSGVRSM